LSACQLGITMASLGLGWIGEPAIAHLLRPLLQAAGVVSEIWIHGIAFAVAFTSITAAHLVFGEQAPKIYALRRPETILLWVALPLKFFYFVSYPFMIALNATTSFLLKKFGVKGASEHDSVHSEDAIKGLLALARKHGELSRVEHRLLNAVFEFDDTVCRRIMQPRSDTFYSTSTGLSQPAALQNWNCCGQPTTQAPARQYRGRDAVRPVGRKNRPGAERRGSD